MKTFICTKYNLNIHRWQSSWIMNLHTNILHNHEKRKKWYISIKACSKDTKVLCRFWLFQFLYNNYINPGNLKENHDPGNFHSFTSRYLGKSLRPFWDSSLCRMAIIPSGMVGEIKWDHSSRKVPGRWAGFRVRPFPFPLGHGFLHLGKLLGPQPCCLQPCCKGNKLRRQAFLLIPLMSPLRLRAARPFTRHAGEIRTPGGLWAATCTSNQNRAGAGRNSEQVAVSQGLDVPSRLQQSEAREPRARAHSDPVSRRRASASHAQCASPRP